MASLDQNTAADNLRESSRIQSLIIGRLVVTFLLLITSWIWHSGTFKLSFDNFPQGLFLVFVISVGLTIVYFFLLRLSPSYSWQIRAQFLTDLLLVTWLVWRTGDVTSPYITLYIVVIGVSSLFLKPRPTLLFSALSTIVFVGMCMLVYNGLIIGTAQDQPWQKIIQIVSFHVVAFLVVGLLAARLSDRHNSGQQLEETARTLASLRLLHERIIESIRSGLITTDLNGSIYTFNAAATEITGLSADAVTGTNVADIFGDISVPIEIALAAASDGEQSPRFETDLITPDGFAVRIGYGISLLYSKDNEASGYIITFQDLTQIRSMEDSVRRKERLAALGRVAAGLAHEIRNPLGAMRGAIQVLDSGTERGTAQAQLMDIILKESDRLNGIITNFLNYARPAATNFAELDLTEAIRETVTLLRHSPDVSPTHEIVSLAGESPLKITGDVSQIKQIFWNLSRNAIQAMPDGGTLTFGIEPRPNNRIRISITDTGRGMPPERVEQLFEPFAHSTTGGTGLGLSIVYQIVRDHGGSISVKSRENGGTTISIDLPREAKRPSSPRLDGSSQPKASALTEKPNVESTDIPNPHFQELLKVDDR